MDFPAPGIRKIPSLAFLCALAIGPVGCGGGPTVLPMVNNAPRATADVTNGAIGPAQGSVRRAPMGAIGPAQGSQRVQPDGAIGPAHG
jgi:hypothetical protein